MAKIEHAEELLARRELAGAERLFRESDADPDRAGAGLWMVHMLAGDFEAAWRESDAIRARGAADPHRFWNGADVRGKRVMLRCLHGLGDAVQFLRYVPRLQETAAALTLQVPPELLDLAPCFAGVGEVITWEQPEPAWDLQVEVVELPYLFRTRVEDLPVARRYLRVPARAREATDRLQVGMVWASGEWNPKRSVPFDLLRPVLETDGCLFWNLQGGTQRSRWRELGDRAQLRSDERSTATVLELARFIRGMDLVLTPDGLPAHVAGALGVPAWVMLERAADWRWMVERVDSPWYPSLRLFRQQADGDWEGVVDRVRRELVCLSAGAPATHS